MRGKTKQNVNLKTVIEFPQLQRGSQAGGQAEADSRQADRRYAGGLRGAAGHHGGHPQPADRGLLLHPRGLPHRQVPVERRVAGVFMTNFMR